MNRKAISGMMLTALILGVFGIVFNARPHATCYGAAFTYETKNLLDGVSHPVGYLHGGSDAVVLSYDNAIYIYDLSTSTSRQISGECDYIGTFDANSRGNIVWIETIGPVWKSYLYLYDGETEQIQPFGEVDTGVRPQINERGDMIFSKDNDLFLYEETFDRTTQITDDDSREETVQINNYGDLLWASRTQTQTYTPYIYFYNGGTRDTKRINENPISEVVFPKMSERTELYDLFIIWTELTAGRKLLFRAHFDYSSSTISIIQISDPEYNVEEYQINSKGDIVWTAKPYFEEGLPEPPQGTDTEVFLYRRFQRDVIQVTNDDYWSYYPAITTVYVGNRILCEICYVTWNGIEYQLNSCRSDSFSPIEVNRSSEPIRGPELHFQHGHVLWAKGEPHYSGQPPPERDVFISMKTVLPAAPVADAGPDWYAEVNSLVTLDGSRSSDSEDVLDELLYSWTQTSGTSVYLMEDNTVTPSFTAPSDAEDLTFQLTVTDTDGNSDSDDVKVSVWDLSDPQGDADADGLLNDWELNGLDFDEDGIVDVDLPAMGADPLHKDIFVEVDYEEESVYHTHSLLEGVVEWIIWVFKDAPVANPDMTTGIKMHIDAGPETIMNPAEDFAPGDTWGTGEIWGALSASNPVPEDPNGFGAGTYTGLALQAIMNEHFSSERAPVFHYCLSVHVLANFPQSGGYAWGSNFTIADHGSPSVMGQTCGFIHELGHTLGLKHGGGDNTNGKPNYLSLMNYNFANGISVPFDGCKSLDYSFLALPPLNEADLDETIGLSGPPEIECYATCWYGPDSSIKMGYRINGWLDWNCDNIVDTSIQADLNKDGEYELLQGYNDWANLCLDKYSIGYDPQPGPPLGGMGPQRRTFVFDQSMTEEVYCLPFENIAELPLLSGVDVWYRGPNNLAYGTVGTFEFYVRNIGEDPDNHTLVTWSSQEWADLSSVPLGLHLAPGEIKEITIPIEIPDAVESGTIETITLKAYSTTKQEVCDVTTARFTITDTPGSSPFADAGFNRVVEATSSFGALVTLDGTRSYDPDGGPLKYEWTGSFGVALGKSPTVLLPKGPNLITLNVTDTSERFDYDHLVVVVRDTTTPQNIEIHVEPTMVSLRQGDVGEVAVDVLPVGISENTVSLSSSGQPTGVLVDFDPESATPPFTSIMTVEAAEVEQAWSGIISITVTGVDEEVHTTGIALFVFPRTRDPEIEVELELLRFSTYILMITTIVFIATTVYFLRRTRKTASLF